MLCNGCMHQVPWLPSTPWRLHAQAETELKAAQARAEDTQALADSLLAQHYNEWVPHWVADGYERVGRVMTRSCLPLTSFGSVSPSMKEEWLSCWRCTLSRGVCIVSAWGYGRHPICSLSGSRQGWGVLLPTQPNLPAGSR